MNTTETQSLYNKSYNTGKDTNKVSKLSEFIEKNRYFEPLEQIEVCNSFDLHYMKNLFRDEYRKRFYNYLFNNVTTCADVEKNTSIPHKYLTECKKYYEDKNLLKVVGFGVCPVTKSRNVQYLCTNPNKWNNTDLLPINNQLKMF
ncbi:hypothetical protein H0I29_07760 [Polaribacter sp. R2A056_3_33]|uniref:hypothetical protein n=1 Tax=Polaribacter sp. R2A056_3_33 TaxID=2745563 RepID=UPI001C4E4928|nr:hypothetical protein [Polaribacter sp. R2A056_3_33]QXP71950.1 hypothetical protein H0I29_07760 [Polaribacter sp. R2A056_3_33]